MVELAKKCTRFASNVYETERRDLAEWIGERGVYQSPIACQHRRSKKNQDRICSTNLKSLGMTARNKEKQKGDCGSNENFETETVSQKPIGNIFFKY